MRVGQGKSRAFDLAKRGLPTEASGTRPPTPKMGFGGQPSLASLAKVGGR
jgi:hypothetical protein